MGLTVACTTLGGCSDRLTSPPSSPSTPRPPTTVAVAYGTGIEPTWVAFQDGDGAWTRAQPTIDGANTTFRSAFSTNRGGIATIALYGGGLTILSVQYSAPAELASAGDTLLRDCGPAVSKSLLGTVAGLDTNESAVVTAGGYSRAVVLPAVGDGFALGGLASGPQDLLATRTTRMNGTGAVTGFILRRDLDLPDSTTLPVLDFASTEAFAPAVATVSVNGLGPEGATAATRLVTSRDQMPVAVLTNQANAATRPYFALPETRLRPSDLQVLRVTANPTTDTSSRSATLYFRAPTDRTLTLGAPLTPPTFSTVANAPALRLWARFAPQDEYDRATTIAYQQGPSTIVGSPTSIVEVSMTAAYAARTVAGYDLGVPDLSGAAGFNPAWALHPGGTLMWSAGRIGGTLGLGRDPVPSDGATQRSAFRAASIPAQ